MPTVPFIDALRGFAARLQAITAPLGVDAWPEDQLKSPVTALIEGAAEAANGAIQTFTEVRADAIGRPDVGVTVGGLLTGYVELKRPGKGADPRRFTVASDRNQWERFKNLPNVIYTDGNDWALYRNGERIGQIVRFGDMTTDGAAAVTETNAAALLALLRDFFGWAPAVPRNPRALANLLAPVCRLLRDEVAAALGDPASPLTALAADWRRYFFPEADDAQFADAYAQTLTYALLLARLSGADDLGTVNAARQIEEGHTLLSVALRILGDDRAREALKVPLDLLDRIISAVDPAIFVREDDADPWLYFYEDFLAAYDPRLRRDRGVYYTPVQVVQAQVRLLAQLLDERFDKPDSFASEGVVTLDPACGTGTYLLAALQDGLDRAAEARGPGALVSAATRAASQLYGFELLVGPYAVAHLRLTQQVTGAGGNLPDEGIRVFLTDTLESPHATPPDHLPFQYQQISEEHRRAQEVKARTPVLVCLGNPPYDRENRDDADDDRQRKGGWVRHGDLTQDGRESLMDSFTTPLTQAGAGQHAKNLYNDYVYFWRWALWKVFEQGDHPGLMSFITAASYLRGPGFAGMRQVMRQTFDELWIIDLEGGNLGARKTENVFAIQTPVCIAMGLRTGEPSGETPARVRYARIEGTSEEKLTQLAAISGFEDLTWVECSDEWMAPFLPTQSDRFAAWPLLADLFPWQANGMQFKRSWPIAEAPDLLQRRWRELLNSASRGRMMKETDARKANRTVPAMPPDTGNLPSINSLARDTPSAEPQRYAFRSFDRQWMLPDGRVCDRPRPEMLRAHGAHQVYLTGLLTEVLGEGPALTATHHVPDLHYFRGSFGGAHVIPLWRDSAGTQPNVTDGVLGVLAEAYGAAVLPEDLFAYAYALLATPAYVEQFWDDLKIPGPRLPVTRSADLFRETAALGRRLLFLHTYGERFVPPGGRRGRLPRGTARIAVGTPATPEGYPESFSYDPATQTLHVGAGQFSGVRSDVWGYSVSGLDVVKSWLDYRKKNRAGRASSPLDQLRPTSWTFDEELLDLLWLLEATLDLLPQATALLARVLEGETFAAGDLPAPTEAERRGPEAPRPTGQATPGLFDEA